MTDTPTSANSADLDGRWEPDRYLDRYQSRTIPLGDDPDDEGSLTATLVRKPRAADAVGRGAVLYVHGFSDYFFHEPLADFFDDLGYAFYALDLRKCGRSREAHQTAHYTSDLAFYDAELNAALDIIATEIDGSVVVGAHSTGGIITPLWLHRLHAADSVRHARIGGLFLNSPWFDLQGSPILRSLPTSLALRGLARVRPKAPVPVEEADGYGRSIHQSGHGEWAFDLGLKPLGGFPMTFGTLNAVRAGHAELHRGIDVGVPSLVLRSDKSVFDDKPGSLDNSDVVLDVRHMARWCGYLGDRVTCVPITDALHDVFLSTAHARDAAYREVSAWVNNVVAQPERTH